MQVLVRDNNVDQALKFLKKKMQREGIFREMKLRGHYEKPSEKRVPREGGSHPPPQDHPHIYLNMGDASEIICPYCSTLFRFDPSLGAHEADPADCAYGDMD